MYFPLKDYLGQLFPTTEHSPVFNPHRYWLFYCKWHLQCCFESAWLERCWTIDYSQYVSRSAGLLPRHRLEENNATRLEYCWFTQLQKEIYYAHPCELFVDT